MTTKQLLEKIQLLNSEQIQVVSDFIDELDDDFGLEEDMKEFDDRLQGLERNHWKDTVSLEEIEKEFYQKHPEYKR